MFNWDAFVSSIGIDKFIIVPDIVPCNCARSPFVGKDHGSTLKGDQHIINNKLRMLIWKTPKYAKIKTVDFTSINNIFLEGVD